MQTKKEQQRLLNCTKRNEITGCLIWTRHVSIDGYGRTMVKDETGKAYMDTAHRAAYRAFFGSIPKGRTVVQGCGLPLCINPEHLKLVEEEAFS